MLILLKAVRWFDRKHSAAVAKQKVAQAILKQHRAEERQKSATIVRHRDIKKVKPPL